MEPRQDHPYDNLLSYTNEVHEKNRKRLKYSGIVLVLLPVVLGLVRWLTHSDKTVFLIVWVLFMFLLAAYLVSVDYYDHVLYKRLRDMTGIEADPPGPSRGEGPVDRLGHSAAEKIRSVENALSLGETDPAGEARPPESADIGESPLSPDETGPAGGPEEGGDE